MDINEYQKLACKSASKERNLAILALGIAGESGEVADHIKKHLGHGHDLDKEKLIAEMGDVLWYLAVMADTLGVSLKNVAGVNIDKLSRRYPEGFSEEASRNRKE